MLVNFMRDLSAHFRRNQRLCSAAFDVTVLYATVFTQWASRRARVLRNGRVHTKLALNCHARVSSKVPRMFVKDFSSSSPNRPAVAARNFCIFMVVILLAPVKMDVHNRVGHGNVIFRGTLSSNLVFSSLFVNNRVGATRGTSQSTRRLQTFRPR